ncbi:transporter [Chlorobaculum thiosulfatiphilum]|uniref:Transporter n=1 Tax=Chlorobaculum thiosulfatiphilum TaxID=115852 RepID=A0A5C4S940_CHLTI|nr:transporter [Chlorobaculum thiosulfatiphilum]TNJ39802.1 transporter [Chlorobaculum thiosulfatiphilum]
MQKKTTLLASALILCSTPLFAAMPLQTDDTGTQGKGHSQIEIGFESVSDKEREAGVSCKTTGGAVSTTLSYGLSDTIDLVAGMPWEWYTEKEDGVKMADGNGIGDVALQIKWRFYELPDTGFSLALKPGLTLPTGDEKKGLGSGKVSGNVTLIATREAKLASYHINLGYNRSEYKLDELSESSRKNIWRASLAAELNVTEKLRAVGDIGIETNSDKDADSDPAYILGGLIYAVADNADLDLGIRGGLNDAETDTTLLAGVTMRF